jgi:hypothetical protein
MSHDTYGKRAVVFIFEQNLKTFDRIDRIHRMRPAGDKVPGH